MVHYVRDDGGEEAEQHDRRAGIHDRVQKLPRVMGERQHLLQILGQEERERERAEMDIRLVIINTASKKIVSEQEPRLHRDSVSNNPPKDKDDELSICTG